MERDHEGESLFESIVDDPAFKPAVRPPAQLVEAPQGPEPKAGNAWAGRAAVGTALLSVLSVFAYLGMHASVSLPSLPKSAVPTHVGSTATTAPTSIMTEWAVGDCVKMESGFDVSPVSCSGQNSGTVIAREKTGDDCPTQAATYVNDGDWVYCVELH